MFDVFIYRLVDVVFSLIVDVGTLAVQMTNLAIRAMTSTYHSGNNRIGQEREWINPDLM